MRKTKPKNHFTQRITAFLTALALVLSYALVTMPATAYASSGYPKTVYTSNDTYMYTEASICSEKLDRIKCGTQLTATEEIVDWQFTFLKVEYNGMVGYVDACYISEQTVAPTDWEAVAEAWEEAGMEDYAEIIREVEIDKTLSVEDMDLWTQGSAYIGASMPVITDTNKEDYAAYAEATAKSLESYTQDMSEESTSLADTIVAQVITDSMSDYEKALAIYNWMRENITYDYAAVYREQYGENIPDDDKYASGVLTSGTAVCQGYSDTFHMFMAKLGISDVKLTGTVTWSTDKSLYGDAHGWNMVKVDGQWYHVDVTNGRFLFSDDAATAWGYTGWRQIHSCPSNYGE